MKSKTLNQLAVAFIAVGAILALTDAATFSIVFSVIGAVILLCSVE